MRLVAIALVCLSGLACKRATPGYCGDGGAASCGIGMFCEEATLLCKPSDGGADDASDAPPGCKSDNECTAAKGGPACVLDGGTCVACLENKHCTDKTKPLCAATQCVPCSLDEQCPVVTKGKGLCIVDGHCATADELVYVQNIPACLPDGGTPDHPFCTSAQGVSALGGAKSILILRGTVDPFSLTAQPTKTTLVTVIGQQEATVIAGSVNGITIRDGTNVSIRDLRVTDGTAGGIEVTAGSTLILDRSRIDHVKRAGILIDTSAYQITNTVVTASGSIDFVAGTAYPAVVIRNSFGRGPTVFAHNTIAGNSAALSCDQPYPIEASILTPSMSTAVPGCMITSCCTATATDFTDDYHLVAGSSCIDQVSAPGASAHDIDGDARPYSTKSDCGADEYFP